MADSTRPRSSEFFPDGLLFDGTLVRDHPHQLIQCWRRSRWSSGWLGTRRMKLVPARGPEPSSRWARTSSASTSRTTLLGKKDGKRFLPILTTFFFMILFMNLTGIIPFLNIAGTERHRRAAAAGGRRLRTFIYAGVRKSPGNFFKNSLVPPGRAVVLLHPDHPARVPLDLHHPPDHADAPTADEHDRRAPHAGAVLRRDAVLHLHASAAAGRCSASERSRSASPSPCFEILVAFLQAYVFAILTAVYIQLAVADEH